MTVRYNAPDVLSPVTNNGTLTIRDTVSNALIRIPLQGSTGNSIVTLSADTLNFPDHEVGRSGPPTKTLAIRNDAAATADARVDSVIVSDIIAGSVPQLTFSPSTGYPRSVGKGDSLVLTVTFNPLTPTNPDSIFKDFAASLTVHNTDVISGITPDSGNPNPNVDMTGTGLAPQPELIVDDFLVFAPAQLDMGQAIRSAPFTSQATLTIRNNALPGNPLEVLKVFGVLVAPGINTDLSTLLATFKPLSARLDTLLLVPIDTLEVLQGQTASFTVQFRPRVEPTGALSPASITANQDSVGYSMFLSIDSNDPTDGNPTITLTGQGFIRRADVNFSGSVNVTDATKIIDAILLNVALPDSGLGTLARAVYNLRSVVNPTFAPGNDDFPNVLDVVRTVLTIINKVILPKIVTEGPEVAQVLIGDVQSEDGRARLPVMVENSGPIYGAQMNLKYDPRALSLSGVRLTERSQDMTLAYRVIEEGKVLALLYSFDGRVIPPIESIGGVDGSILDVEFEVIKSGHDVSWEVEVENIILSDLYGNSIALDGFGSVTAQVASSAPDEYLLSQNYPNPFNPGTTIEFAIPVDGKIVMDVIDISGQRVRRLDEGYKQAGSYSVVWDGLNERGMKVASGVYFYRIRAGDFVKMRKMVLLK